MSWPWKIVIILIPTIWAIGAELYFSATRGPTWTWLISHYVPQTITIALIGALISWLPTHFKNAYEHYQNKQYRKEIERLSKEGKQK